MARLAVTPLAMEAWARRRRRARQLVDRHPFAAALLRLYEAILEPQERAFHRTLDDRPEPASVARYTAAHVMPEVAAASVAAGPPALAEAIPERLRDGDPVAFVAMWLAGERQPAVDEYLARAAAGPVLEALGPAAGAACRGPGSDRDCPRCGGRPQVSYLTDAGQTLVSGPRMLLCCRCGEHWIYPRMTCAGCGELSTEKLPIFADAERLPHLRVDACQSCRCYLITVDGRKDPEAVPVVDELAALPLDLVARERGFTKIVPNLMAIG
jgi:formate dehydrogenase maturation protein FdhE